MFFFFTDGVTSEDNESNTYARGIVIIKIKFWFLQQNNYNIVYYLVSVPPRYDPVFRLSPPPSVNTFPCLIDPSEGAFEAFDIKPK